jgi:hypothetical protein
MSSDRLQYLSDLYKEKDKELQAIKKQIRFQARDESEDEGIDALANE